MHQIEKRPMRLEVYRYMRNLLKGPALVYCIVRNLYDKYPENQIGKTKIQKLMYLCGRKLGIDFEYSLFHYGPYSQKVTEFLNISNELESIKMQWDPKKGYFIKPDKEVGLERYLNDDEVEIIEKVIDEYGEFTATKLSIIATALFVKEVFGEQDWSAIIDIVSSIKNEYTKDWIVEVLKTARLVDENQ